nr:hypothetical protein [Tanacetum cinerariifolium]
FIQDTPSAPKSKPATSKTKLKGPPSLTLEEQEAEDIMLDESTVIFATSSKGTGIKSGVPDEEKDIIEEKTMMIEAIKQSESYHMFIKYSTSQIRPKKSRGKGLQGKKTSDDSQETVDVSEESEPKHEPVKKKTSSKRRVKKKVTLFANDNIISDDPDAALELAKSISKTKAGEAEEERQVHATHARIMTESVPESAKKKSSGRSSKSVFIQDTPSAPKSKPATSKTKLKGPPSLTLEEQEAEDIM